MKFDYLKAVGIREEIREFKAYYPEESREFVRQYFERQGINPDKPKILISPNSPREYKKWKPEYFAEVADRLAGNPDYTVFILQGPGEEDYVQYVVRHLKRKVYITPPMTIDRLLAWIDFMDLYIGNCGGPKHMAVALGTPSVTIFGPTDPIVWHPHEMPVHIALVNEKKRFSNNTFGIEPEQVIQAAGNILQKRKLS
jgi:ADP-heptose:LPS heptosyltransferase